MYIYITEGGALAEDVHLREGKRRRRRLLVLGPDRIIFIIDRAQEQNKYTPPCTPFALLTTTVEMDPIGLPDDDGSTAAGAPGSEPPLQVSAKFPLYDDERKKS